MADPTLQDLEQALFAAEKAMDVPAAKAIVQDMQRLMQRDNPTLGMPDPFKAGQAGMPGAIKSVVLNSSPTEQAFAGAGSAPMIGGMALAQLAGADNKDSLQNWQAVRSASPYTQGGNLAGNIGMFAALPSRILPMAEGAANLFGSRLPAALSGRAAMVGDTIGTSGLTNYMLEPGEFGDRAKSALIGMGTSVAVPGTYAVGAGVRRKFGQTGQQIDVGERLIQELGDKEAGILQTALRAQDPNANIGVLTSSAQKTGNPALQVLESGSRAKRSDLWQGIDANNADARWEALLRQAGTREELEALKAAREARTGSLRQEALDIATDSLPFAKSGVLTDSMTQKFTNKINDYRTGKFRPNQDVQKLADYVEGQLKAGVTPEQLYEVRKMLTDGVKAGRNDELSNAIKASRAQRMELVGMIDESLNDLTAGGWKEYLSKYAGQSLPISSKQALQDIVGALRKGMPEGVTPPALGESPAWKTLGILRDRYGTKEFGSKVFDRMTPEDRGLLEQVIGSLKSQADVMKVKGILGSQTAGLLNNAGRADAMTQNILARGADKMVPFGGAFASKVFDSAGRRAEQELATLLQNPQMLAEALLMAQNAQRVAAASSKVGAASGGAAAR